MSKFRNSVDGYETRMEARISAVEAGEFPTDETDEKFRASSFDHRLFLGVLGTSFTSFDKDKR